MQNTLVLLSLDEKYRKRIMAASQGKSDVVFYDSSWTRDEYISALQCVDVLLGAPEPEDLNSCQNHQSRELWKMEGFDKTLEGLKEGMMWGDGLDVTDPEPLPQYHLLWKQPRVMITPHASGNVHEQDSPSVCRILDFVVRNYEKSMQEKVYENIVDFDVGYRKG